MLLRRVNQLFEGRLESVQIRLPKPFFLKGGQRAVLLLHGFTGNSADVRLLGRFLNQNGYTCYAPHYRGHGALPEDLVRSTAAEWWQDVRDAYLFLNQQGYHQIAVCGLSLGGVFSLKCGYTFSVKGIVPLCAPYTSGMPERIINGAIHYAERLKLYMGIGEPERSLELARFRAQLPPLLEQMAAFIEDVRKHLHLITAPALIVQARQDEMIDRESANRIYNSIQSPIKQLNWYEQSTHIITLGTEKKQVFQDIRAFLDSLDWSDS